MMITTETSPSTGRGKTLNCFVMRQRADLINLRGEKYNATGFQTICTLFKVQLLRKTREWMSSSMGQFRLLQDRNPTPPPAPPTWLLDRGAQHTGPWVSSVQKSSHQSYLSDSKLLGKEINKSYFSMFPGTTGDAWRPSPQGTGTSWQHIPEQIDFHHY